MMVRHPRPVQLRRWLEGGALPRVDRHVAICDRCATLLTDIAPDESAAPDLRPFLADALAPEPGLIDRVEERVAMHVDRPSFLGLVSDLYAAGLETVNLLVFQEDLPRD